MTIFFARFITVLGALIIVPLTVILVALVCVLKFFKGINLKDPFYDSRRHPLGSPGASRG